jgi:hypothetical protein
MEKEIIIQRLSYIKYLYLKGEEQSRQAEVVAGFSILTFHDAIEMLLMLVYEHLDCGNDKNYKTIDDYLGNIPGIKMKESVKSLNSCRKSLKHQGLIPAKAEIEKHRVNAHSILQENTSALLNLDFDAVSLIDLVSFEECKQFLNIAQELRDDGKYFECIIETRKAFNSMFSEFEDSKKDWYKSLFNIGRKPRETYKDLIRETTTKNRDRYEVWFKDVDNTINDLRDVVKIISVGINYKQYALFNAVAPKVWHMTDGTYRVREVESYFNSHVRSSKELCDFCINFVIDCAVKFQDSDYETSQYLTTPH